MQRNLKESWPMTAPILYPVSRRGFLRGVGVTMALPWLESLSVWGDEPTGGSSEPPVRFACLFSGNGFHSREWWARGEGAQMELGRVLESLLPFREKLLFIKGLYNQEALTVRSGPASAAIRCSPIGCAIRPRCRAWCWGASRRSRRSTRTTR